MMSDPVSIDKVLSSFTDLWDPRIVARAGGFDIRVAKFHGEYIWHTHSDTDEVFIVIAGELTIYLRDGGQERTVTLGPHDVYVVSRGTEHKPVTTEEAHILMMETTGTVTTRDSAQDVPAHIKVTTGKRLSLAFGRDPSWFLKRRQASSWECRIQARSTAASRSMH